ncbi:hypothetical protein J0B03_05015 [Alkalibacter rhizosphaerae]|uniref:CBS domain-containing protein n=1 Tax=Alkalibacter rhizosphaerae TaxID=2815577 RepID=A0A975AIT1_9FIRM|nr:DUF294 nucleotidyltransferase-like domain-containing protein [Alkalibacter rhizosphaerae]QSX09428.1 hypothetical protein J0B03_05015 [Alkalibacter rhizosphaerae]
MPLSENDVSLLFDRLDTDDKIKNWFDAGSSTGEDFFDQLKQLNDAYDRKKKDALNELVESLKKEEGYPPVRFCWMVLGSGGRREQVYRTDQDNGLIHQAVDDPAKQKEVERYFQVFAQKANQALASLGFALCPGDVMAENDFWRGSTEFWRRRVEQWVEKPTSENIRNLTIFLDFRGMYGSLDMAVELRQELMEAVRRRPLFLTFLAQDACSGAIGNPLRNDRINVKTEWLVHLVDCVRVFAIKNQCVETNTCRRIDYLEGRSIFSSEFSQDLKNTLERMLRWRMLANKDQLPSKVLLENWDGEWQETTETLRLLRSVTKEEFFPNS